MAGFQHAEADRRATNIVQVGAVTAIDTGANRARVRIGGLDTQPLPVTQLRSGTVRFQWMPSPGEQVVVYAPRGDMERAFIGPSIPVDGGAVAPDAATPTIDLGGSILSIIGDIKIDGTVTVTQDVIANGISLVNHTHPESIGSVTGKPQ